MPQKTGKRKGGKASAKSTTKSNGNGAFTPPDRFTWPGWIEIESEPAFFNTMLRDMGVRGVKVNEVWSLEDNDLAMLPQPVHALIFLFRYQETDKAKLETECPKGVWYAEQVPDFACATFALLNIVNNIPGLEMGRELHDFKDFTLDKTPLDRGAAVDDFDFVKRIHNSFARDADILQADLHLKEKFAKARREQAAAKAKKTKAANAAARAAKSSPPEEKVAKPAPVAKSSPSEGKIAKADHAAQSSLSEEKIAKDAHVPKSSPPEETPEEQTPKGTRTSKRNKKPTAKAASEASTTVTPKSARSSKIDSVEKAPNGETTPKKEMKSPATTPSKTNGASTHDMQIESPSDTSSSKRKRTSNDHDDEVSESIEDSNEGSSPPKSKANASKKLKLNAPKTRPARSDPNADFIAFNEQRARSHTPPRRSTRERQPRKDLQPAVQEEAITEAVDEEGFHFCAYMPIGDRVWKLDGMDRFPQDMGPIEPGMDWLNIAQPALQDRMAQYAAGAIEFNLMAVVHDPLIACVASLAANIKTLEATEAKLADVVDDWKEMLDGRDITGILIDGNHPDLGMHNVNIEQAELTKRDRLALDKAEGDLSLLLDLRKEIVLQQSGLRRACEDEMYSRRSDAEKAGIRRHDHTEYVKKWTGDLNEKKALDPLFRSSY